MQFGNAHEAMGVEIVAEQQRVLRRRWGEQPRPAVVEEIALVNRLHAERASLFAEWREDGLQLSLILGPQCGGPERALATRPVGDVVPEGGSHRAKNLPAASIVRSISSSPWASDTNIASYCDGAM